VHVGLSGNERADAAAKEALNQEVNNCQIPPSDIRPIINRYILIKWQEEWNMCKNNKLYETHPEITNRLSTNFNTRFDQVVYTRCRIGHTSLTHAFLLKGEDPTLCMFCKIPLSVTLFY